MQVLINAIIPIFSLIMIGYFIKRYFIKEDSFFSTMDSLTYYLLMPSLLFSKISSANLSGTHEALLSVGVLSLGTIIITLMLFVINIFLRFDPRDFTSLYQGAIRYNTYIFFAIIGSIYGEQGLVIAAFIISFLIPLINLLSVSVFALYIKNGKFSLLSVVKRIAKNPLIISCLLGGMANYFHADFRIFEIFSLLGSAAISIGLLSVGAGLRFADVKHLHLDFHLAYIFKLFFFPCLSFLILKNLDIQEIFKNVSILFASMPTASTSYIFSKKLGGNKDLMSMIITAQTLLCPFSIWLVILIFL